MSYITPLSRKIFKEITLLLNAPMVSPSGRALRAIWLPTWRPPPPSMYSTTIAGLPGMYLRRYGISDFTRPSPIPPGAVPAKTVMVFP